MHGPADAVSAPSADQRTGTVPETAPTLVNWWAIGLFVVLAWGLAWLAALPLWLMGPEHPGFALWVTPLSLLMMFTPAVATLIVMWTVRVPAVARARWLGLWPLRPAKRVVTAMVIALFAPLFVVLLSVAIAVACGWITLDLQQFSGMRATIDAQLATLGGETAELAAASLPPMGVLVLLQLISIPFGALFNSIFAFGEELGWRGWLVPALQPLGVWPALLLSGAIWGLWHAPLTLLGHNFGLYDWRGVALMTVGCVCWGVLLGWSRLRTGSVWPAVFGHGALNAAGGVSVLLVSADSVIDPVLVLPLGVAGWIAVALIVVVLVLTGQFSSDRRPELAPRRFTQESSPGQL